MPLFRRGTLTLLVLLSVAQARAARTPQLRLTKNEDLPAIGLRTRLMSSARARPLPPPTMLTYTRTRGTVEEREDRWDPLELWRHSQHAGEWSDDDANVMALAVVRNALPGPFRSQHVTRGVYDEKLKAAVASGTPESETGLRQWVKDFTGKEVRAMEPLSRLPMRLAAVRRVRIGDASRPQIGYLFKFKRSAVVKNLPLLQYFVWFSLNPKGSFEKSVRAIEGSLVPALAPLRNMTGPDATKAEPGSKPGQRTGAQKTALTAEERSRAEARASIRNLEDWWYADTANYIMLANLGPRHKLTAKKIQEQIEEVRVVYERLVPPRAEIDTVCVVRMFNDPKEYTSYVGSQYEWTGGLWSPNRRELVLRPPVGGSKLDTRKRFIRVMYHEAFHQYLFYAFDRGRTSPWFNEGHAVFFEAIGRRSNRVIIEENDRYSDLMDELARGRRISIGSLLELDYEQFYAPDEEERKRNYGLAWALIYYLQKGARAEKRSDHRQILTRYANAVSETGDPGKATAAAFADVDMTAFEKDFTEFWKSRNRRSAARRHSLFK